MGLETRDPLSNSQDLRLGVDVGGTFTDIVLMLPDGTVIPKKVLSSPPDFNQAIRDGVASVLGENAASGRQVREFTHGATVATNCILTRSGAVTGLITSKGFRDVLEIRRMRMHKLYDIGWEKPEPLVPRHRRLEVDTRTDPHTGEEPPLDEGALGRVLEQLKREGVESVAVCYLHAYAAGANERRTRDIIKAMEPSWFVSISSEVLPEIKEYERTSTTVINAYVQPAVARYAQALEQDLRELGVATPVRIMQSNGGMVPLDVAARFPIHIVESGPAAGVTGAHALARRIGVNDAITFDMGGTTAKAAIIEDGEISRSPEYEVGGEISIGHRMMKGSGYLLRVPSIDLAEVSAGGGSIAWLDSVGALKVGPRSAGAIPGPACYGRGGTEPTITDANVHLGFTNPESLAGGTLRIDRDLAQKAIRDRLAAPLSLDVTAVSTGIRAIANASLIRALRAVSLERGRDPRRFTLIAFGGMGPVHALEVAAELAISKVIVPPLPGLFSALSLLFAEVEHHLLRTHYTDPIAPDIDRLNAVAAELAREATATLAQEGFGARHRTIALLADLRYVGQDHALTVPLPRARLDREALPSLYEAFQSMHETSYGYRSERERVQVVALRCIGRGLTDRPKMPDRLAAAADWQPPSGSRRCYFGHDRSWIETAVVARAALDHAPARGPLIVEEDNALTVVPPGWRCSLDPWSNIVIEAP
jgi:N-methylhydantoinase A